jgi:DNA-binding NtrC family response regulator
LNVLLVEDERSIAITLRDALAAAGHRVTLAAEGTKAIDLLRTSPFDCVVTDVRLPGADGMEILRRARALSPPADVLVVTGFGTIEQAVAAMKEGATTYLQKPFLNEAVVEILSQIERTRALRGENVRLVSELGKRLVFGELVGTSAPMREIFERIERVAPADATVLLEGESGTGKERVARAIHRQSPRASGPFVPFACAALPESMVEDELFGHERGAFTDAHREKRGRFELAHGGTVFLDDIEDTSPSTQVKLLRVLQERSFERVGGERTVEVDVRVVAATKIPLRDRVKAKRFREDLFWRLNVVPIRLPPLRERKGDVRLLAEHFLSLYGRGRDLRVLPEDFEAMERYPWPGNVRELENAIERAVALAGDSPTLSREHLLPISAEWRGAFEISEEIRPLRDVLAETEKSYLRAVLEKTGGHRTQTSRLLGISRKMLWEKIREHGLEAGRAGAEGEEEPPEEGPAGEAAE